MRRLRRGKNDEEGWELPDLLVVDGGKGQLGVAVRAREDIGVPDLDIASVAKPRVTVTGEEEGDRVFRPGQKNAVPVRGNSALSLLLLARGFGASLTGYRGSDRRPGGSCCAIWARCVKCWRRRRNS